MALRRRLRPAPRPFHAAPHCDRSPETLSGALQRGVVAAQRRHLRRPAGTRQRGCSRRTSTTCCFTDLLASTRDVYTAHPAGAKTGRVTCERGTVRRRCAAHAGRACSRCSAASVCGSSHSLRAPSAEEAASCAATVCRHTAPAPPPPPGTSACSGKRSRAVTRALARACAHKTRLDACFGRRAFVIEELPWRASPRRLGLVDLHLGVLVGLALREVVLVPHDSAARPAQALCTSGVSQWHTRRRASRGHAPLGGAAGVALRARVAHGCTSAGA